MAVREHAAMMSPAMSRSMWLECIDAARSISHASRIATVERAMSMSFAFSMSLRDRCLPVVVEQVDHQSDAVVHPCAELLGDRLGGVVG
jgi:hypothetical protein